MSLFSYATDAITYALDEEADYVDVRIENSFENFLGVRNKKLYAINTQLLESIGIRVLFNGFWGFASTSSLDNSNIKNTVKSAVKSAKKIAKLHPDKKSSLASITSRKTSVSDTCEKQPQLLEHSERIDLVDWIESRITSKINDLLVLDLKLNENHTQKFFINSEGTEIEQILIRASIFTGASIKSSGILPRVRTVGFGGVGGIEQFQSVEFDNFLENFILSTSNLAQAKQIKPKKLPVILNEEMSWNLCHEFCHAVESDLILEEHSPLGNRLGSKIGSEQVTIIDDASFKGFGEYYFDDEGVKASGTLIVEDGILFDVLQTRETAAQMNAVPTSNGRAENCLHPPQVRQSNTFFEPGNYTFDELLENIKDGLYICDSFGGMSDTVHGNFQLDAQYGMKIAKGELTDYVSNFSLIGNLYTILGDINGLTKNIGSFPAYCGKNGQRVSVGAISPKVSLVNIPIISSNFPKQSRKVDITKIRER